MEHQAEVAPAATPDFWTVWIRTGGEYRCYGIEPTPRRAYRDAYRRLRCRKYGDLEFLMYQGKPEERRAIAALVREADRTTREWVSELAVMALIRHKIAEQYRAIQESRRGGKQAVFYQGRADVLEDLLAEIVAGGKADGC